MAPISKPDKSTNPTPVVPHDPAEYQRFLAMAREVGADEDEGALDRAFDRVIKPKVATIRKTQRSEQ